MQKQHGEYLITAGAARLPGDKWQPRLTMTRLTTDGAAAKSQSFSGLSPAFETSAQATRHAFDLGKQLVDGRCSRLRV